VSILPLLLVLAAASPHASADPTLAPLSLPSPAAAPTATSEAQLKEIGRVRALSPCSTIVIHANDAIRRTLGNDGALKVLASTLGSIDLDTEVNPAKRRVTVDSFYRLIGTIKGNAEATQLQIKQLHELAAAATDPTRKHELNAFADALAAALERQKSAANETGKALLTMVERADEGDMAVDKAPETNGQMGNYAGAMHAAGVDESSLAKKRQTRMNLWNRKMRLASEVLLERTKLILSDESQAAGHADRVIGGC
jgi:hypothetical protein